MCNLYRMRTGAADILAASRAMSADVGNLEPRDIYPDYSAPIVRNGVEGRELVLARWGLPSSSQALFKALLLGRGPDPDRGMVGTTTACARTVP